MNCPKCNAVVNENSVLCQMCGARIDRTEQTSAGTNDQTSLEKPTRAMPPSQEVSAAEQVVEGRMESNEDPENRVEGPWPYSAKAMRGALLVTGLVTLLLVAVGVLIEVKLWAGGPHLVLWAPILVVAAGLWLYQLAICAYRCLTISYSLTPHRLFHQEGLLVRRKHVIEVLDIDDIDHSQSLWERFVCGGMGTITIHSSDPGTPVLVIRGLANHEEVFQKIDDARRKQRQKRGLKAI